MVVIELKVRELGRVFKLFIEGPRDPILWFGGPYDRKSKSHILISRHRVSEQNLCSLLNPPQSDLRGSAMKVEATPFQTARHADLRIAPDCINSMMLMVFRLCDE